MAEEVGSGYVSLVPSMRNFSRLVRAELRRSLAGIQGQGIEVPVIPQFDQRLLNESLQNRRPLRVPVELEPLHDRVHGNAGTVRVGVEIDRNEFQRALTGLGRNSRSTIHQRVDIDTDRNAVRNTLLKSMASAGSSAADFFTGGFLDKLLNPFIGIPVAIAAAVALPQVALAAGAATLGGAALGAVFFGAFLLKGDKDIQRGFQNLLGNVKKTLTDAAKPLKGPFLESIGIIGQAFRDISPDIKTFFADIAKSGGIQDLARGVGGLIKSFSETGAMKKLGQAIGPALTQIGMALPDIGNAISQLIITVSKPQFAEMIGKILRLVADLIRFVGDAIGWFAALANVVGGTFKNVWAGLKIIFNALVGAITANMDKVRPLKDLIVGFFVDIGKKIGLVPEKVNVLVATVKGVPNKVKTALGDLGGLLLNSGRALVQGLIDGIQSKLGALGNMASNMAKTVWNYMQHSPAKMGPLSGRGNTFYSGQEMAGALAAGMGSKLPTVATAAGQLAGAAAFGNSRTASSVAAAQPTVRFAGPDAILEMLRKLVENEGGGNVQFAFGRGGR